MLNQSTELFDKAYQHGVRVIVKPMDMHILQLAYFHSPFASFHRREEYLYYAFTHQGNSFD